MMEDESRRREELSEGVSQNATHTSGSGEEDPPSGKYTELRYYEKLLHILGGGDDIFDMVAATTNFNKQRLTSIHDKAGMYLTHPAIAKILCMHDAPGQEYEGGHEATEDADELVPVRLKDLETGKRNECVVVYGELCVDSLKFGRIYTILEEAETGKAVVLSIVSPDFRSIDQLFARNNYPIGAKIAVKEPMLVRGEGGLIFINVDNPLSIETVQSLPTSADVNVTVSKDKFDRWRIRANEAFKDNDWEKCIRNHTKCAACHSRGMSQERDIISDLYLERWTAYIQLGRFQESLQVIEKYCDLDPDKLIAAAHKIQSLLSVGRYKDAFRFLELSCYRFPNNKETLTTAYLSWIKDFDIGEAILEPAARSPNVFIPDGDFIGLVEIRMTSNGNGRGLFATENIEAGKVLLISKALAIADKPTKDPVALLQIVKDAITSWGEKTRQIFLSHRMKDPSRFIPKMSDFFTERAAVENKLPTSSKEMQWTRLCNTYENLSEMKKDHEICRNIQRIALDDSSPAVMQENCQERAIFNSDVPARLYYGIWLLPSFINHSCAPNAARINQGDILRIHAARPIDAGEEITIPYFNVLVPYFSRQQSCKPFGIRCLCNRCQLELKIMKYDQKTKKLYGDYLRIAVTKIENPIFLDSSLAATSAQLQSLVIQVENCLKVLRKEVVEAGQDLLLQGWIRGSFTSAYFAFIANRKRNLGKKAVLEENDKIGDTSLYDAANGILATCPGSLQHLIFWQRCFSLWKDRARRYEHWGIHDATEAYEEHARNAQEAIEKAFPSVYGNMDEAILQKLLQGI